MAAQRFSAFWRFCSGQSLVCVLTLCTFAVSSFGVPYAPLGQTAPGCRCAEELQAAGRCCCANAARRLGAEPPPKTCCAATKPTPARSCCAATACSREQNGSSAETPAAPQQHFPLVSACHCGGSAEQVVLINAEPRLLPGSCDICGVLDGGEWLTLSDSPLPFLALTPETPPPIVRPV